MRLRGRLVGSREFMEAMWEKARDRRALREIVERGAEDLAGEMKALVPRETGELESEITAECVESTDQRAVFRVGVRADSPAIDAAWATETGSHNFRVGTPSSPKTSWEAKSKAGATMPWARTALLRHRRRIGRQMQRDWAEWLAAKEGGETRLRRSARGRAAPPRRFRRVSVLRVRGLRLR